MSEQRIFKTDDGGHIALKWDVAGNPDASKRAGRPIHDKVIRADLLAAGQSKSTPSVILLRITEDGTEKRGMLYEKYARQVEMFRASDEGGDLQGTPLDRWPAIDVAMAANLKAMKIFTVEQLAASAETLSQRMMGGRDLAKKAENWLAAARDGATVGRLTDELAQRDRKIEDLQRQLTELANRMQAAEKPRGKAA